MKPDPSLVEELRDTSRQMARAWGYMGGRFAGTELSPSAVHALIEIERGSVTARELGARLQLEKSSVSRMLRKLVAAGDVREAAGAEDGRVKLLSLTAAGRRRVAAIHTHAKAQVSKALGRLQPGQHQAVLKGMRLYTEGLTAPAGQPPLAPSPCIVPGYQPGLIARITDMHARYYVREAGFGQAFESVVAGGLAEFCDRLQRPKNAVWAAVADGEIVGSVAIDGEDLGNEAAHLRWFIVDDGIRGGGIGRQLLGAALAFVDGQSFPETHLWTFSNLTAARHLYESLGFVCVEERPGDQWGQEVLEQRFVRVRR